MLPLLKLNAPEVFSSGLWLDTPKNQPGLWKDGLNVQFSDGVIEKNRQPTTEFTTDAMVTGLATADSGGTSRAYIGAGSKVILRSGSAHTEIGSGFSGIGEWDFEPFGTWLLATNNQNKPQIWKNTGLLVDWPTAPFPRARLVKKLDVFPVLVAGQEIAWPSYNNPEDFVPGPGKRAGQFFVRDLDGDIMAMEPLGDALVYYSQDMFGFMRFVGGEAAMSIKTRQGGGIGAVSTQAVVSTGTMHFGVSRKGLWQSDGNSFKYIARPAVARWFEANIDWLRANEVVTVHDETAQRVIFYFPTLDGGRKGLGYNYDGPAAGRWQKFQNGVTAFADQGVFRAPLVGVGNRYGFFGVVGADPTGEYPASLLSWPLDMGSTDRLKRWQMVEIHAEIGGVVEFRVGYSNFAKEEPDWQAWRSIQQENWLEDRESVFLSLEFRSTTSGATWKITGLEVYGQVVGKNK